LGVNLYEMLFGTCPYEEKSIKKLLEIIKKVPLVIHREINNISNETEELLRKLLVKDPKQRIRPEELFDYDFGYLKDKKHKKKQIY